MVAAGGTVGHLRIWDLHTQRCAYTVNAGLEAGQGVTSISSAWPGTHLLCLGTTTGAIHVVDTRLATAAVASAVLQGEGSTGSIGTSAALGGRPAGVGHTSTHTAFSSGSGSASSSSAVVSVLAEHTRYVTGVAQARAASAYSLVSASIAGDVRFWDLRASSSAAALLAHKPGGLTALALHDYAPLLATGSALKQNVCVFSNAGEPLSELRYHEGFAGQRIGPVSSLAWHPHRLLMAVGATDSLIGLYHGQQTQ
jgi:WD40 repeat protein